MTPGGVQEIISYFAGILHLFEDPARDWHHLLYPADFARVGEDLVPIGADPVGAPDFLDPSASGRLSLAQFEDPASHLMHTGHYHALHVLPMKVVPHYVYQIPLDHVSADMFPLDLSPIETATQPPIGPLQEDVYVNQTNKMVADQVVGLDSDNPSAQADPFHATWQVGHMVDIAQGLIPGGFDALNNYQTDGQALTTYTIDPVALVARSHGRDRDQRAGQPGRRGHCWQQPSGERRRYPRCW
jgi:hypothetical protein